MVFNTKGYPSSYLAMGFANVRAGTRVLMLVLVLVLVQLRRGAMCVVANTAVVR